MWVFCLALGLLFFGIFNEIGEYFSGKGDHFNED